MNNYYLRKILLIILLIIIALINKNNNQINISKIIHNFYNYKKYYYYKFNYKNNFKKYSNKKLININNNNDVQLAVAICVIAKEENLYIKEFINHYKQLGVKKIFLYDNNELNGENFNDILNDEIINEFIEIIDYRGKISPQKIAYKDCFMKNNNKYDWIAFYDTDEFLYMENYESINKFLSQKKFKNCSSILINWKYYGDNNNIYYEPKELKKRFNKPFSFDDNKTYDIYFYSAAKSIVRGRGKVNLTWAHFPHFLNNSNICRPDGNKIQNPLSKYNYSYAYIKHYSTKSTEEFLIKLFKRKVSTAIKFDIKFLTFWLSKYYFLFNKVTKKKLSLIKRILKLDISKNLTS